jgi:hypothetical protein
VAVTAGGPPETPGAPAGEAAADGPPAVDLPVALRSAAGGERRAERRTEGGPAAGAEGAVDGGVDGGPAAGRLCSPEQLPYLSPVAAKLLVAVRNRRSGELAGTYEALGRGIGVGRTRAYHALAELQANGLVAVAATRDGRGRVSGVRVRALPPPAALPAAAREARREALLARREALEAALAQVDEDLARLERAAGRATAPVPRSGFEVRSSRQEGAR